MGLLIAFMATFFWACSAFPFTKAGRAMSVPAMNLLRLVLGSLLILIVTFIFEYKSIRAVFSWQYSQAWIWLGISGLLSLGIGDFLSYRMYTILSPRYGAVFTTISPASALLFGMVLLDEQINFIGVLGMMITIFAVISLSFSSSERKNIPDHGHGSVFKGIVYGTIGALCHGAGLVFSKKGFLAQAENGFPLHPVTGSFIRFITAAAALIIFYIFSKNFIKNIRVIKDQPFSIIKVAIWAIVLGPVLAVSCSMISIQNINVAVAQTIFALVPVVALLISHFLYNEKITRHSLLGAFLAITGVSILIWSNTLLSLFM